MYLDEPFAYGKVVNISTQSVSVTPSVKLKVSQTRRIDSPQLMVQPGDTATASFFITIPEKYNQEKANLSYADFYVTVTSDQPDDQSQKATLINSVNAWDGKVINLRYFIKKEMNFSMSYAKSVLSENKDMLDTLQHSLYDFEKAKILFNDYRKENCLRF